MLRKELAIGLTALLCLFSIIIITEGLTPTPLPVYEYLEIDAETLLSNPSQFEGVRITTGVTIVNVTNSTDPSYMLLETHEGLNLLYDVMLGPLQPGSSPSVRGISYMASQGYVEVLEIHFVDENNSLIRSIPGVILFLVLFFMIFSVDFRKLGFVARGD